MASWRAGLDTDRPSFLFEEESSDAAYWLNIDTRRSETLTSHCAYIENSAFSFGVARVGHQTCESDRVDVVSDAAAL
jgi:hypothetical protein